MMVEQNVTDFVEKIRPTEELYVCLWDINADRLPSQKKRVEWKDVRKMVLHRNAAEFEDDGPFRPPPAKKGKRTPRKQTETSEDDAENTIESIPEQSVSGAARQERSPSLVVNISVRAPSRGEIDVGLQVLRGTDASEQPPISELKDFHWNKF